MYDSINTPRCFPSIKTSQLSKLQKRGVTESRWWTDGSRQVATALTYLQGLRQVSVIVHVNVAYALGVTHDGDMMTLILNGAHELRRSAWDYQVYVALQWQQVADFLASRHLSHTDKRWLIESVLCTWYWRRTGLIAVVHARVVSSNLLRIGVCMCALSSPLQRRSSDVAYIVVWRLQYDWQSLKLCK